MRPQCRDVYPVCCTTELNQLPTPVNLGEYCLQITGCEFSYSRFLRSTSAHECRKRIKL
jgi:hypothetical protein